MCLRACCERTERTGWLGSKSVGFLHVTESETKSIGPSSCFDMSLPYFLGGRRATISIPFFGGGPEIIPQDGRG